MDVFLCAFIDCWLLGGADLPGVGKHGQTDATADLNAHFLRDRGVMASAVGDDLPAPDRNKIRSLPTGLGTIAYGSPLLEPRLDGADAALRPVCAGRIWCGAGNSDIAPV